MLYRIDYQTFLLHAIDYFTLDDLIHIQYSIFSAGKVKNLGTKVNVVQALNLYPDVEMIETYAQTEDPEVLYKMYKNFIEQNDDNPLGNASLNKQDVYETYVKTVLDHYDIMIICDRTENAYVDALTRYIKEEFKLEAVNLNTLFQKGRIGPIYIDRDKIHDRSVKLTRGIIRDKKRAMESTRDGKAYLITIMNKKEKLQKLDELGITPMDNDDIDDLLTDAWVNE